jgi:Leu/Phe-tRNA-protein transferase
MFHEVPDAGKVAVFSLLQKLYETGHRYVDTQTVNDNTRSNYHAYHLPRMEYLRLIENEYLRIGDKAPKEIFGQGYYRLGESGGSLEVYKSEKENY